MAKEYPLTKAEFETIYARVPRLTVEVIVKNSQGAIYMTKRAIEPCKGQWHLPGGTVYFGESLLQAVKRIAQRELGLTVQAATSQGYIEYPSHYKKGLDQPVGVVFEVGKYKGSIKLDAESADGDWFTKMPRNTHADQNQYLLKHKYLSR